MKQKTTTIIIGVVLIVVAFFGGKAYGQKHAVAMRTSQRTAGAGGYGGAAGGMGGGRGGFGGGTIGQVLSKDATSITVSTMGGGSKIILYSPSTTIAKTATGSITDITAGETIVATGTANPDGSVTATAIQIRPAGMTGQAPQAGTPAQ